MYVCMYIAVAVACYEDEEETDRQADRQTSHKEGRPLAGYWDDGRKVKYAWLGGRE